jgi:hypothetical protein
MALSFKGTIPSLTTDNSACWVVSMWALLDLEGLWDEVAPVNPACSTVGPLHAPLPGDERNNGKALSLIVLHVAHSLNHIVAFCTSAREAWQKLSDHFEGFGLVRKWELRHKLATLKCGHDFGSVSEMCAQVNSIVSELAMIGEPVPDKFAIASVLAAVHPRFQTEITMFLARQTLFLKDCLCASVCVV